MHDLRTAVFRHLQRLSLAFFTRTRTGEVQSRISNDIGGVQSVVTTTATSIVSNVTTVLATMVGMLLLSWELALFAFALIPIFVLLTRRVGNERRRIAKSTQETLADISSLVQESLSVSGILLGKTMGRTEELADRFDGESQLLADLEVRQRMAGRWMMAMIQTSFAVMPAATYWFGGLALAHGWSTAITVPTLVSFTTLQARLFFPVGSLLGVGLDVQTSLALFDRIFEYLDQPVDIIEADAPRDARRRPATSRSTASGSATTPTARGRWRTSRSPSRPERRRRSSARRAPARRRSATSTARLYDVDAGERLDRRRRRARPVVRTRSRSLVGVVSQETYLFHATRAREPALREAGRDGRGDRAGAAEAAQIHDLIASLPERLRDDRRRARLPLLGRREAADRDRAHDPPQPADPRARRGDELARHRDRAPGAGGARPAGRADARRSRSPTGSRRSSTPTRSSCSTAARIVERGHARRARSSSAAATPSSSTARRATEPRL